MKIAVLICLGILTFLYGICILMIRSGTLSFVLWFGLTIVFWGLAVLTHTQLLQRVPLSARIACKIAVGAALVLFLLVEGLIISGFYAKPVEGLDYVVVLGAQVRSAGPSRVLQYRLDRAYDYLMENPGTTCIVSGGQGFNEPMTEAEGMYQYLVGRGLPAERMIREDQSRTTPENLENSRQLMDSPNATVGVVTNNFHVYRSLHLAKRLGLHAYGIPAKSAVFYLPNNMFREFFGVVRDVILGR